MYGGTSGYATHLFVGMVRRRSDGMLAPFVAHVAADVVIFAILVCWVR